MTHCALPPTYWSDTGFYLYLLLCQLVSSPSMDWVRRACYFGEENAVLTVSVSGLASLVVSAWRLAGCLQESRWDRVSVTALRDIERGLKTKKRSCRVNKESIPWRTSDQSCFGLFCQQCWKKYCSGCDAWQFRCQWLWTRSHFSPSSWPSLQLWHHCWLLYQLNFNASSCLVPSLMRLPGLGTALGHGLSALTLASHSAHPCFQGKELFHVLWWGQKWWEFTEIQSLVGVCTRGADPRLCFEVQKLKPSANPAAPDVWLLLLDWATFYFFFTSVKNSNNHIGEQYHWIWLNFAFFPETWDQCWLVEPWQALEKKADDISTFCYYFFCRSESQCTILFIKDLPEPFGLLSAQVVDYFCQNESAGVSQHLPSDLQYLLVGKVSQKFCYLLHPLALARTVPFS